MISEGITFHSLSATYCRIQCWRNSFVTGSKTWAKLPSFKIH